MNTTFLLEPGELARVPFAALLIEALNLRASGALRVEHDGGTSRIFIREGIPVGSQSFAGFKPLGQIFLSQGRIDLTTLNESLAGMAATGRPQGQILVEMGAVDQAEVDAALTEQQEQYLSRIASLESGTFHFDGAKPPPEWTRSIRIRPLRVIVQALEKPQASALVASALQLAAVGPLSRGVGEELYRVLRDLEVDLCVPLIQNRNILGLVGLGRRLTGAPMAEADRELLATLAGLSANALQNSHLYVLAIFDGLTRVFNHRYFMRRLREEFQRAKRYVEPLSLLMVDIDHFKKYNDTHGHLRGDRVLADLAELVMASLRRDVDIVARYGGEEFACILPETDGAAAFEAAERIRRRVESWSAERDGSAGEPPLTISVGVSTFASDWPGSAEELIEQADRALYTAKRGGRHRVETARRGAPS